MEILETIYKYVQSKCLQTKSTEKTKKYNCNQAFFKHSKFRSQKIREEFTQLAVTEEFSSCIPQQGPPCGNQSRAVWPTDADLVAKGTITTAIFSYADSHPHTCTYICRIIHNDTMIKPDAGRLL